MVVPSESTTLTLLRTNPRIIAVHYRVPTELIAAQKTLVPGDSGPVLIDVPVARLKQRVLARLAVDVGLDNVRDVATGRFAYASFPDMPSVLRLRRTFRTGLVLDFHARNFDQRLVKDLAERIWAEVLVAGRLVRLDDEVVLWQRPCRRRAKIAGFSIVYSIRLEDVEKAVEGMADQCADELATSLLGRELP